jgi:hypothetical protein
MTERLAFYRLMSRTSFERMAIAEGWALQTMVDPGADRPYEQIWWAVPCAVHYIEDQFLGQAYVIIDGATEQDVRRKIENELPTLDLTRAVREYRAASTPEGRVSALGLLAATAPGASRGVIDVVHCLEAALRDPDSRVRHGGLLACAYASWPALQPAVAEFVSAETDPQLTAVAVRIAERLAFPHNDAHASDEKTVDADAPGLGYRPEE